MFNEKIIICTSILHLFNSFGYLFNRRYRTSGFSFFFNSRLNLACLFCRMYTLIVHLDNGIKYSHDSNPPIQFTSHNTTFFSNYPSQFISDNDTFFLSREAVLNERFLCNS